MSTRTEIEPATRAHVFQLLARLLRAPVDPELRSAFLGGEVLQAIEAMAGTEAVLPLRLAGDGAKDNEDLRASERQDFMDLFHVPVGRYVRPYESVYRDGETVDGEEVDGRLWGASTRRVDDFYRQAGARFEMGRFQEVPDHVVAELSFLAFLAEQEAAARAAGERGEADNYRALYRQFLVEHPAQWVPALCERIRSHAKTELYRGIAALTAAVIRLEATSGCEGA